MLIMCAAISIHFYISSLNRLILWSCIHFFKWAEKKSVWFYSSLDGTSGSRSTSYSKQSQPWDQIGLTACCSGLHPVRPQKHSGMWRHSFLCNLLQFLTCCPQGEESFLYMQSDISFTYMSLSYFSIWWMSFVLLLCTTEDSLALFW